MQYARSTKSIASLCAFCRGLGIGLRSSTSGLFGLRLGARLAAISEVVHTRADAQGESRAAAEGYDCRFTVTMATDESGILQVDRVTVHCGADDIAHLREIQEIVTSECGVPAERQEVIAR